jgi:hypothetical protein
MHQRVKELRRRDRAFDGSLAHEVVGVERVGSGGAVGEPFEDPEE